MEAWSVHMLMMPDQLCGSSGELKERLSSVALLNLICIASRFLDSIVPYMFEEVKSKIYRECFFQTIINFQKLTNPIRNWVAKLNIFPWIIMNFWYQN